MGQLFQSFAERRIRIPAGGRARIRGIPPSPVKISRLRGRDGCLALSPRHALSSSSLSVTSAESHSTYNCIKIHDVSLVRDGILNSRASACSPRGVSLRPRFETRSCIFGLLTTPPKVSKTPRFSVSRRP